MGLHLAGQSALRRDKPTGGEKAPQRLTSGASNKAQQQKAQAKYDLSEKQKLYAAAGIKEYWVVNLLDQQVYVFRNPGKTRFRSSKLFKGVQTMAPHANAKALLDIDELFRES